METLRRCSAYLVEHERVDGETFDELFDGRRAVPKADDEWRAATARPRAWGDIVDLAARRVAAIKPQPAPISVAAVAQVVAAPTDGPDGDTKGAAAVSSVASAPVPAEPVESIATIPESVVPAIETSLAPSSQEVVPTGAALHRSRIRVRCTPARRARRAAAGLLG